MFSVQHIQSDLDQKTKQIAIDDPLDCYTCASKQSFRCTSGSVELNVLLCVLHLEINFVVSSILGLQIMVVHRSLVGNLRNEHMAKNIMCKQMRLTRVRINTQTLEIISITDLINSNQNTRIALCAMLYIQNNILNSILHDSKHSSDLICSPHCIQTCFSFLFGDG